ncbi:hypothetical protein [Spongiactinospora sp. TRM90649]|uniref:hypothetical protein n=1 Tax=Spongiactinospora sp. TRM90649 TaxID=3031114 RepID=UPI0023F8C95D|nr:hypothetical protein [Spongiactinospora sp. TRM90649]MDF5755625.1 hypothetical protein [Spongiactinospora sp. TRM90649]
MGRMCLDWAAIALVGVFGVLWTGVVVFAAVDTPIVMRVAQAGFGVFLMLWTGSRSVRLVREMRPSRR